MRSLRRRLPVSAIFACSLLLAGCAPQEEVVTIAISAGATGQDLDLTVAGVARFMEEHPNIRVLVVPTPRQNQERLNYYQHLFREDSSEVDVFQVDVVWIGAVAPHAVDLYEFVPDTEVAQHFDLVVNNNTVEGRLVALPWYADMPSLYYRKDLLEKYGYQAPPATWDELTEMARKIQEGERRDGNLGFWGYVWQGAAYEGLTCNALEWQYSSGGGNFISPEGRPNLNSEGARAGFRRAASWIGTISPAGVLSYDEEESRLVFQRGDAAFLRNWAYFYALAQDAGEIGKKLGVAPIPGGTGGRAAVLGGWNLMVSRYSNHPREAAALVRFLAGVREQKLRALTASYLPTIAALYRDPEILQAAPFFEGFDQIYPHLVARPSSLLGEKYPTVSRVYSQAVHDILSGADPAERLAAAEAEINSILQAP